MNKQTENAGSCEHGMPIHIGCDDCTIGKLVDEINSLKAANAELLEVLNDAAYLLEKARIWGGMEWVYQPLHPIIYLPARIKIQAAIAKHEGAA